MSGRKIRILHVIRQGKIGGGETHVLQLVSNLPPTSYTNIVLSFSEGEMVEELNKYGIENYVIRTNFPFDIRKWVSISKLIKKTKPGIIHAHGTRACSNVVFLARRFKIPIIYTVHGWSFHPGNSKLINFLRRESERFLLKKTTKTISVSHSDKRIAIKELNFHESIVIQNGVDISRFNPKMELNCIRRNLGISDDAILIGLIARLTKQKDPEIILDAFSSLGLEKRNCYLLYVGDGDLKSHLVKKTIDLKLEGNVKFVPFQKDVRPYLKGIDIYCLPSLWEGLPIGLLEAVSMNRIVVATNIDPNIEVLENDPNSFMFTPGNERQLHDALEKAIKTRLENKRVIGSEKFYNKYSIERTVEKVDNLYYSLI